MNITRRDALMGATAAAVTTGAITAPLALKAAGVTFRATPTTLPERSNRGPPLFPCWTGAVTCKKRRSSSGPASALTFSLVTLGSDVSSP